MAGSSKRFSIEAVFKAIDKVSNPLKGMNRNTSAFSRKLRTDFARAQRQVDNFARNFKKKVGTVVRGAILGVGLAAAAGLGMAGREFVDFQDTIIAASAKFGPAFQQGTEGFERLGEAARKIGAETEFSAKAAAEGLDFLALAGFNAEQSISLLPGVVDLATAAQTDLASASDIASDSLGAFGLMTKDSAQLATNFNRVMDVMAKTTTTSNTDLNTLFESVKKGGASFTAAGQSLESFNALAGSLANAGLKGAESGTQLRNIMLKLSKPTAEAAGVLKQLGVQTTDEAGNFRDIIDIIGDFQTGLSGMGTAQRSAALATVFGSRSVTGMNLLLDQGADSLRAYRETLEGSTGAASEMAEVMRGSLKNQIASLQSAALELGFKFIEAFQVQGGQAITGLTEAVRNFNVEPILAGINTAIEVISFLVGIITPVAPIIMGVVTAFGLYKAAMIASAAATGLLNAAMNANPVSLIITGVGILLGLFFKLVQATGGVKEAFIAIGKAIMTFLLTPLNLAIEMFQGLIKLTGMIPGLGAAAAGANDLVQSLQDKINQATFYGGDDEAATTAAPISSAERASVSREESRETAELTIKDETGRAEMSRNPQGRRISFNQVSSGAL